MAEPAWKSPKVNNVLNEMLGVSRPDTIRNGKCVFCGGSADEFKDKLSLNEYAISGLCQRCQDDIFDGEEQ